MMLLLLTVLVQDLSSRSVSWPVFPLITLCGFGSQLLLDYPLMEVLRFSIVNLLFLGLQFLIIWLYFVMTRGRGIVVLDNLIGWGDILFITSVACTLPVIPFITFYVLSLLLVLTGWLLYHYFTKLSDKHIPLAGLQALLLAMFLAGDWLFGRYDIYDDQLLNFLIH
jgi:hypothetical protein